MGENDVCSRAGLLIGWEDGSARALVARADCDSWKCAECAERLKTYWLLRADMGARDILGRGERLDFVTITSHEKLANFNATERVWRSAWDALYQALKRRTPRFQYMIVPERHKSGRMHVHALWNASVTKRWLKDNARRRGLGYECAVEHVDTSGRAQRYVVKYVGKDIGTDVPRHFRRVRVSRGWVDVPKPKTAYDNLRWEYIGTNGALDTVYKECQAKHITLIDISTGEIFDDVDLGTIIAPA